MTITIFNGKKIDIHALEEVIGENSDGSFEFRAPTGIKIKKWFNKRGNLHRLKGPALISDNGTMGWFKNGKLHREDGPAFKSPYLDTYKYYLSDIEFSYDKYIAHLTESGKDTKIYDKIFKNIIKEMISESFDFDKRYGIPIKVILTELVSKNYLSKDDAVEIKLQYDE